MKDIRYYLNNAQKGKFAIAQFNFSDFTQMKAILEKAQEMKSPVILGTSEGESKFFGLGEAVALRDFFRKKTGLPVFLNLDHGKSFEYVKQAIDAGYDMVHFDGSKLLLEENIKITKEVMKYAKSRWRSHRGPSITSGWKEVLVEGEVGKLGTDASIIYAGKFEIKEENLTKPEEASKFLKETKIDLLAVSIGNFHGIEVSGIDPNLRLDVLKAVKGKIGNTFLVLHGGSGTPEDDLIESIKLGIVKININTELRLAFSGNIRRVLDADLEQVTPYKFLADAKESVARVVGWKIKMFGSENKA